MKNHSKKLIAPIIVTVIIDIVATIYFSVIIFLMGLPILGRLIFALIYLFIVGVGIYVLIERIKEVKGGEEDDLSKY